MSRSTSNFSRKLEEIFGPVDGPARMAAGESCEVISRRRDIALFHHLACGPVSFKISPPTSVSVDAPSTQFVFVNKGSLKVDQMKTTRVAAAGDIMLISNWTPFLISAECPIELRVVALPSWWAFQKIVPNRLMEDNFRLPKDLFCMKAIHALQDSIFAESHPARYAADAVQMLAEMLRRALYIETGVELEKGRGAALGARIGQIMRHICQNIESEDVSPQTAAQALRCSVRTVHKACADQGTSFNKLLMDARVQAVAYLLTTSSRSISEIAYSVGFSSFSHFCRLFKLQLGQSASAYRKRYAAH